MNYLITYTLFGCQGASEFTKTTIIEEDPMEWYKRGGWQDDYPEYGGCNILMIYARRKVKKDSYLL